MSELFLDEKRIATPFEDFINVLEHLLRLWSQNCSLMKKGLRQDALEAGICAWFLVPSELFLDEKRIATSVHTSLGGTREYL